MNSETTVNEEKTATGWSMVWGVIMFMCGLLAIALPLATSIGIVIVLAWLILFSAVAHLIFAFHSHSIGGVIWKLLLAVFYGFTGFYMVTHPILGVATVTIWYRPYFCFVKEWWRLPSTSIFAMQRTLSGCCSMGLLR